MKRRKLLVIVPALFLILFTCGLGYVQFVRPDVKSSVVLDMLTKGAGVSFVNSAIYIAGYKERNCSSFKKPPKISESESSSCFSKCFYIPLYGSNPSYCESIGVIYDANKKFKEAQVFDQMTYFY